MYTTGDNQPEVVPFHDISFGSSAVRVNTETVYSGCCEAGVVMTSVSGYRSVPGEFEWSVASTY